MKTAVICGSIKSQEWINYWCNYFKEKGYKILDYPRQIETSQVSSKYINFYRNIENSNILFIVNEDKNNIKGYIGPSTFAELLYAIMQNQIYNKHITIYLLKMPDKSLNCYDEIKLFLNNNWIHLFNK